MVNYDTPNHHEEYVHRCACAGVTSTAGAAGATQQPARVHPLSAERSHTLACTHRVGRTGRAGNKGTAITFISPEDDKYAPDLVKALTESGAPVPQVGRACTWAALGLKPCEGARSEQATPTTCSWCRTRQDLELMATTFTAKRRAGLVVAHGSGYGGTGFKFDRGESDKMKQVSEPGVGAR